MPPRARQPHDLHQPLRDLSGPAVAVHLVEERFVAGAAGIVLWRQHRRAGRVAGGELVGDGGGPKHLLLAPAGCTCPTGIRVPSRQIRLAPSKPISASGYARTKSSGVAAKLLRLPRAKGRSKRSFTSRATTRSPTRRRNAAMPVSRCRVGCTRLVSSVQATPRRKSIQTPVPVKPVCPIVSSEHASPPDQPACRASHPGCACRPVACACRRGRARARPTTPARHRARRRPFRIARHAPMRPRGQRRSRRAPRRAAPGRARCIVRSPRCPPGPGGTTGRAATAARAGETPSAARWRCRAG